MSSAARLIAGGALGLYTTQGDATAAEGRGAPANDGAVNDDVLGPLG